MLLKIQPMVDDARRILPDVDMMAYNEDRTFFCRLDAHALDADAFKEALIKRGVIKGYFWAFMEEGKQEIVAITEPKLPAQPW